MRKQYTVLCRDLSVGIIPETFAGARYWNAAYHLQIGQVLRFHAGVEKKPTVESRYGWGDVSLKTLVSALGRILAKEVGGSAAGGAIKEVRAPRSVIANGTPCVHAKTFQPFGRGLSTTIIQHLSLAFW